MGKRITTEAWVLSRPDRTGPPRFARQAFSFEDIADDEVLVEPLYGAWEGNMGHALAGSPLDLCDRRGEDEIVLGNSGVVRVLRCGRDVQDLRAGDTCLVFCAGDLDPWGYSVTILGYDCPGTMGVLARQAKFKRRQLIPLPPGGNIDLLSWAAFSLRYISAFSNWKAASGAWRLQMDRAYPKACHVVAWGGGVALAELELAVLSGCQATLITSRDRYRQQASDAGIGTIARPSSNDGNASDLMARIMDRTGGEGASIFVDNIGANFRLTMRALARQGVITTCGWREGMTFPLARAVECMNRHIHVFTHCAHVDEATEAVAFAHETGWAPRITGQVWGWEAIGELAASYARGETDDYFPMFAIAG